MTHPYASTAMSSLSTKLSKTSNIFLGDVNLPRLQRLALDVVEGDIVLNELTVKHIPKDCYIDISGFDLFQESAQDRVFQSKLMQTFAYSS